MRRILCVFCVCKGLSHAFDSFDFVFFGFSAYLYTLASRIYMSTFSRVLYIYIYIFHFIYIYIFIREFECAVSISFSEPPFLLECATERRLRTEIGSAENRKWKHSGRRHHCFLLNSIQLGPVILSGSVGNSGWNFRPPLG